MPLFLAALTNAIASYSLPAYQIQKLQRVQNSAAHLVFHKSKFCHITPLLRALHWLPVAYRIVFKILLLTFKAIHKLAPTYISELVSPTDRGGWYYLRSNKNRRKASFNWAAKGLFFRNPQKRVPFLSGGCIITFKFHHYE